MKHRSGFGWDKYTAKHQLYIETFIYLCIYFRSETDGLARKLKKNVIILPINFRYVSIKIYQKIYFINFVPLSIHYYFVNNVKNLVMS